MSTSITVVCYKSKTLSNGEHPLMLRICQDRKTKYQSLGVSIAEKHWDFEKNSPKSKCPNRDILIKLILKVQMEYQQKLLEKRANNEEYTADSLLNEEKQKEIKAQTVEEFYRNIIQSLRTLGKVGNAEAYLNSYNSLKGFNNGKLLTYTFSHINSLFLKKYEEWLRSKGNKETTLSFQFRTLRAVFNRAIEENVVSKEKNPFEQFKVSKFNTKTKKRALTKEDMMKIITTETIQATTLRTFTRDVFTFAYLCGGISFVDMANLTLDNIYKERIRYIRQKTHGEINLKLCDQAKEIIEKYISYREKATYLFPILDARLHKTPMQKKNRVRKVLARINKELKVLASELEIKTDVTTYVAKHHTISI
ncbi:MAG: phage integrase SAM-like domain-containing protein [Odoribacter splanchnicus]|jgi:hypothetical protein|uniref:site-specific integrase n=1 Tax=Odoribacter splanchnicus TaxID=28118 RepID=UPI000E4914CF|nr:site-specific integrase [Odoribacter splanchnicus]MBS6595223.1 site-specific integrase [Odoribacter splanchnicus]NUN83208.1 phage integrase SAM-like domain-containing protein [Odoribacter splanchnicus]RHL83959.1 site-specific integrase [Odoribacter splanchnicus]